MLIKLMSFMYNRYMRYKDIIGKKSAIYLTFIELLRRRNLLRKRNLFLVEIDNIKLYIRPNSTDISVAKTALFDKQYHAINCKDPKVIIDLGAHIGTTVLYFANKFPNAKIYAIEPEQNNFEILQKNISKYENVIPIKAAIWSKNENRYLKERNKGNLGYTVAETYNNTITTEQEIKCITLDWLMENYNLDHIDILKIDIEGAEKNLLENSKQWIERVKIISIELHDHITYGCKDSFYNATKGFDKFEQYGEKITAYKSDDT